MRWRCAFSRLTPMAGRIDANGMLTNKTCMAADSCRFTPKPVLPGCGSWSERPPTVHKPTLAIGRRSKPTGTADDGLLRYERTLDLDTDRGQSGRVLAARLLRLVGLVVVGPAEPLHLLVLDRSCRSLHGLVQEGVLFRRQVLPQRLELSGQFGEILRGIRFLLSGHSPSPCSGVRARLWRNGDENPR